MSADAPSRLSRREFVRSAGGVLIGFSLADAEFVPRFVSAAGAEPVSPGRLDSWLQIGSDGAVRVLTGKAEIGMGVETALAQIVAEELDLSTDRIHLTLGDTWWRESHRCISQPGENRIFELRYATQRP